MSARDRAIRAAGLTPETVNGLVRQYETRGLWGPYLYAGREKALKGLWYVWGSRNAGLDTAEIITTRRSLREFLDVDRVISEFRERGWRDSRTIDSQDTIG